MSNKKLMEQIKSDLDTSIENEKDERTNGQADISFIHGDQWPTDVQNDRTGRIKLTINKMPTFLDQIDGDLRQNKQGIKVRAVDSVSDDDTATIIEGLVRYIEQASLASRIYAYAGVHTAAGGRGAWRILHQYVDEISFTQEIKIQRIRDPYTVYYDPSAVDEDKQDGNYFFIVEDVSKKAFKKQYKREPIDFDAGDSSHINWMHDKTVRVAEYFYKKQVGTKKLFLLANGAVKSEVPEGAEVVRSRNVPIHEIWWAKVDGTGIIEGPQKIAGTMFPVVLVWGKELCVEGKVEVRGIGRYAKDSQRMYNYWRSAHTELIALAPKQPYILPDTILGPHKTIWDNAANENYPYLLYTPDPNNPSLRPYKEQPTMPSSGMLQEIQLADRDLRDTVGIHKAALGMASNETSGIAISKRETQSDTGQFAYIDNTLASIQTSGRIIVNMIPDIYDIEGTIRILGEDAKEKVITLGRQNLDGKVYDLSIGKYDVIIDTGPSYSTQREELVAKLQALLPALPQDQIAIITDILFDSLDMPGAAEISDRLKKLLPEGMLKEDDMPEKTEQQLMQEQQTKEQQAQREQQIASLENMKLEIEQLKLQTEQMKLQTEQVQLNQDQVKSTTDTQIAQLKLEQENVRLQTLQTQGQQKEMDLALNEDAISDKIADALLEADREDSEGQNTNLNQEP